MKKFLLFAGLLLTIALSGKSQEIVVKPAIGINFSNFSKQQSGDKYKAQIGYETGASVSFGRKFYVEPGVFYVKKNTEYSIKSFDSGFPAPETGTFQLNGIHIPLTIGYSLIGGETSKDPFRLRILGGGSAFFLRSTDQSTEFNKTQWGIFAGAGVDIAFLFVEAKYEWSLTDVQKNVSYFELGQSRSVFINAGVRIPVGR